LPYFLPQRVRIGFSILLGVKLSRHQTLGAGLGTQNVLILFLSKPSERSPMYVVFAEEIESGAETRGCLVQTLEQAFAQIVCRCGLAYYFEQEQEGWKLVFNDVERPDRSPDPIRTDYKRPRDAKHDLIAQAVDGRIRGHIAVSLEEFDRARIHARIA
jgi:hypothetical protein